MTEPPMDLRQAPAIERVSAEKPDKVPLTARLLLRDSLTGRRAWLELNLPQAGAVVVILAVVVVVLEMIIVGAAATLSLQRLLAHRPGTRLDPGLTGQPR